MDSGSTASIQIVNEGPAGGCCHPGFYSFLTDDKIFKKLKFTHTLVVEKEITYCQGYAADCIGIVDWKAKLEVLGNFRFGSLHPRPGTVLAPGFGFLAEFPNEEAAFAQMIVALRDIAFVWRQERRGTSSADFRYTYKVSAASLHNRRV